MFLSKSKRVRVNVGLLTFVCIFKACFSVEHQILRANSGQVFKKCTKVNIIKIKLKNDCAL